MENQALTLFISHELLAQMGEQFKDRNKVLYGNLCGVMLEFSSMTDYQLARDSQEQLQTV